MPATATVRSVYQAQHAFEERRAESARLLERHPGMVPVVCETVPTSSKGGRVCHTMVPASATVAQLREAVREAAELGANTPVSLATARGVPSDAATVAEMYDHCKDTDGFLYLQYTAERQFGFFLPCFMRQLY